MIFEEKQKTQLIERWEVWEAFKEVKAGGESAVTKQDTQRE
jgi:hypothetical protein